MAEGGEQPAIDPTPTWRLWGFTLLELLAATSALSIVLGYLFFVGFCWQTDWRLLQFMTPQDFVSTAAFYIFAVPVILLGLMRLSYDDYDPNTSFSRIWSQVFVTDVPAITAADAKLHRSFGKIVIGSLLIPLICLICIPAVVILKLNLIPTHMLMFAFVASSLPYTLLTFIHSIWLERKAAARRKIATKGAILIVAIAMIVYGLFEGATVADALQDNVSVHMNDGHEVDGVFVYRLAAGVAVQRIGGKSIHFIPDDEITDVEMLPSR